LTDGFGVGLPKIKKLDEIEAKGQEIGEAILESRLKGEDWQMKVKMEVLIGFQ
jgi:hypothetical protein